MSSIAKALASIYFRVPRGVIFGLDRVLQASSRLGSPHLAFPALHIAGTNGKGSVAAMCANVLRRQGRRVGMFTSPHLCRFAERIQIDGAPADDDALTEVIAQAVEAGPDLTFFETTFLAAALLFREAKVDVGVLEVGMGGRLDATNVIEAPLATAVTGIALDHTDKLGRTLEAIAREKAAIAKPGCPMVIGPMPPEAETAVRETAGSLGATPMLGVGREIQVHRGPGHCVNVALPGLGTVHLEPGLRGEHQLHNAAVAAAVCATARGLQPSASEIQEGIATVRWPARLELIEHADGLVLLDSAHNPDGARALLSYLQELFAAGKATPESTSLVFGAVADKQWREMLRLLAPSFARRCYVEPGGRAPAPTSEMVSAFGGTTAGSVDEALGVARQGVGPAGLVVVAGSIFLVGEARSRLLGLKRDPPVAL